MRDSRLLAQFSVVTGNFAVSGMADSRAQVDLTTQSIEDILGELFESLGDLPAAPDSSGPANTERDRADLSISSASTFQVVPRECLSGPGHRGDGPSREREMSSTPSWPRVWRDAPGSGSAESSSPVEIGGALVRLPDSTNGDEVSEVERILRADGHPLPGTEMTSGDERDRAASQALERSGVLTDEVLLHDLSTPRALSKGY